MLYETGHVRGYLSRKGRGPARNLAVDLIAPSSWGYVNDPIVWNSAIDAYLEDRLAPAYAIVDGRGVGLAGDYLEFSRILEGELALGSQSEIVRLSDDLELETCHADLGVGPAKLGPIVLAEVAHAEEALGVRRASKTLVTVLLRDSYIPTALLAGGYYVEKADYGKICLPAETIEDETAFRWEIRRGICYQILYTLSKGEACRWFLEAATAAVSPIRNEDASSQLRSSADLWLPPRELEHVFQSEAKDDPEGVNLALEQAHAIGSSLIRHGAARLVECAGAHAHGGYPEATDKAIQAVYHNSAEELFRAAWAG